MCELFPIRREKLVDVGPDTKIRAQYQHVGAELTRCLLEVGPRGRRSR